MNVFPVKQLSVSSLSLRANFIKYSYMPATSENFHNHITIFAKVKENDIRPTLGPNVASVICEIWRYWAILEKIFKIHGDIRRY